MFCFNWRLNYVPLHFLGGAPIVPFLPVIVKQMGMSGSAMGFIVAFNQIICLLARYDFLKKY